jgi:hypothetical protein
MPFRHPIVSVVGPPVDVGHVDSPTQEVRAVCRALHLPPSLPPMPDGTPPPPPFPPPLPFPIFVHAPHMWLPPLPTAHSCTTLHAPPLPPPSIFTAASGQCACKVRRSPASVVRRKQGAVRGQGAGFHRVVWAVGHAPGLCAVEMELRVFSRNFCRPVEDARGALVVRHYPPVGGGRRHHWRPHEPRVGHAREQPPTHWAVCPGGPPGPQREVWLCVRGGGWGPSGCQWCAVVVGPP